MDGDRAFGLADLVLSGFLRVVTRPRVFVKPTPLPQAREVSACGNLASDAFPAAWAIETGAEWVPTDRDDARFPGLGWRHPLKDPRAS